MKKVQMQCIELRSNSDAISIMGLWGCKFKTYSGLHAHPYDEGLAELDLLYYLQQIDKNIDDISSKY